MNSLTDKTKNLDILLALTGGKFDGYWGQWSKQTKKTQFFTSSQLTQFTDSAERLSENEDVYMCVSTQEEDVGPDKRGPIDTISTVFAFAADIDLANAKNSDKNYPRDRETAQDILNRFPHAYSYLQDSGRGFHVIWILSTSIKCKNRVERRKAQAISKNFQKRLVAHYKANGYDIDSVGDITRLIRVPYTYNHNVTPAALVKPLFFDPSVKLQSSLIEELGEDSEVQSPESNKNYPPADHFTIQQECSWYGYHTGDGAAVSPEPDWQASVSITVRCKDGDAHAHKYSSKHPEYNAAETDKKLRRALDEAGPRTCNAIEQDLSGGQHCTTCRHKGIVKSPIQLGHVYRPGKEGPIPVGFLKTGNFVLRDQRRRILVIMSANQLLSHICLMGLASSDFWAEQFPTKKGFNSNQAGEDLIELCKRGGPFDPTTVRGVGVWREGNRVIENLGQPVPDDTKEVYLCFQPLHITEDNQDALDVDVMNDFIGLFPWKHSRDADFYLGWLMIAPISGALSWRPHIFVYGPANCGKTTLHNYAGTALTPLVVKADGRSTSAGIRQSLGPDARPTIMDEFESDRDPKRQESIVILARSASSSESKVLMGTPEGNAMQFAARTTFMFSAINVVGKSQADESRIINLELTAHDSDPEVGRQIELTMQAFADAGPAWCRYSADNTMNIIKTIDVLKAEMPPTDSRHKLNMATLLAGTYVALNAAVPTSQQAQRFIKVYLPAIERHAQAHERDDAMECWNYLLAHPVRGEDEFYALGHWLAKALEEDLKADSGRNIVSDAQRVLIRYQMRIILDGDNTGLMMANGAPPIDAIFEATKWRNGAWKRALGQIVGVFTPKSTIRVKGLPEPVRCVGIPFHLLPEPIDKLSKDEKY